MHNKYPMETLVRMDEIITTELRLLFFTISFKPVGGGGGGGGECNPKSSGSTRKKRSHALCKFGCMQIWVWLKRIP